MLPSEPLSVIITTYNRSDALLAVLVALAAQTDRNFDVVVADDGSTPAHREAVLRHPVAAQLSLAHVWHPDVGFTASKARNRGVGYASANYLVFLDGDCVPEVDFIAQHKRLAQTGCLVNGSRVLLSERLTQEVLQGRLLYGRSAMYWLRQRILGQTNKLTQLIRVPDIAARVQHRFLWRGIRSCNMGVWRADFERVLGFDESFSGWGHEDADLVLRLYHAGVQRKNGFCATEVYHLWHAERSRDTESVNAHRVRQRMQDGTMLAQIGYSRQRLADDAVVTRINRPG